MYIKQIKLKNFQSYFGDANVLEFQEGLNIVVGSINKGKSKLFDAFYWVLFGDIYITGDKWISTNELEPRSSFINDRAKYLSAAGDQIEVSVEMVVVHTIDGERIEYTISRKVNALHLANSYNWYEGSAWQVGGATVEISYTKNHNFEFFDTKVEFDTEVQKLFPKEIRNYVWFQGEALDRLIDFSNKSTFEQAIKYISYYPRYEKLAEIVQQAVDVVDSEKNKKIKAAANNEKAYSSLDSELTLKKAELKKIQAELDVLVNHEKEAISVKESTEDKLNAMLEFPPLEKLQIKFENEVKVAKDQIEAAIDKQKEQFQKVWILKGVGELMQKAKFIMQTYEEQRNSGSKYVLPADVPQKVYLERMLDEKMCLVCGTEADEHSAPYNCIKKRIEDQEAFHKEMQDNQELYSTVQKIVAFPDEVIDSTSSVPNQISNIEDLIDKHVASRNKANAGLQEVRDQIDSLIAKHKVSFQDGVTKSKEYVNKMTLLGNSLLETQSRITKKRKIVADLEFAITALQNKINSTPLKSNAHIPEIKWFDMASFMKGVVNKVKERAKSDLVKEIENKANEYYKGITYHNKAVDGKISIDSSTYKIMRTEDGLYQTTNGNTGNFTLMKMCIINSMLSLNEKVTGTSYPFIADAPTSNLDAETTIAYVKSLVGSFGQSIIITKDIELSRLAVIKKDSSIKTVHTLETFSENPMAEKLTQYEAYTKIKRAK